MNGKDSKNVFYMGSKIPRMISIKTSVFNTFTISALLFTDMTKLQRRFHLFTFTAARNQTFI